MKKSKKLCSTVLAVLMVAGLLAGCGKSGASGGTAAEKSSPGAESDSPIASLEPDTKEAVSIKLFHNWINVDEAPYFDDLAKEFESTHPNVHIVVQKVGDPDYKSKLKVMMGADDSPDIFFSWSGEFAYKFIRAGSVWDMTQALDADPEWKNSFVQAALPPFSQNGHVYGIPVRIDSKMMAYNKAIFSKLQLKVPQTYEDFLALCQKLKEAGYVPVAFGDQDPWAACHYITTFNTLCVPSTVRAKDYNYKSGEFTDSGYVNALKMFVELNDRGYFTPNPNSIEHNSANATFFAGQAAMAYVQAIEFKECVDAGVDTGVFPIPAPSEAKGDKGWVTGSPDGFMISSKCSHPEIAMELLKLITGKPWQERMITQLSSPASITGVHNAQNTNAPMLEAVSLYENAKGFSNWLDADVHSKVSEVYLPGLQKVLDHTITPEELMKQVQDAAKEARSIDE